MASTKQSNSIDVLMTQKNRDVSMIFLFINILVIAYYFNQFMVISYFLTGLPFLLFPLVHLKRMMIPIRANKKSYLIMTATDAFGILYYLSALVLTFKISRFDQIYAGIFPLVNALLFTLNFKTTVKHKDRFIRPSETHANQFSKMNTTIDTPTIIKKSLPLPIVIISCLLAANHLVGILSNIPVFILSVIFIMGAPLLFYAIHYIIRPFRKGFPIGEGSELTLFMTDVTALAYNYFLYSLFKGENELNLDEQIQYPIINMVILCISIITTSYYTFKSKNKQENQIIQDENEIE